MSFKIVFSGRHKSYSSKTNLQHWLDLFELEAHSDVCKRRKGDSSFDPLRNVFATKSILHIPQGFSIKIEDGLQDLLLFWSHSRRYTNNDKEATLTLWWIFCLMTIGNWNLFLHKYCWWVFISKLSDLLILAGKSETCWRHYKPLELWASPWFWMPFPWCNPRRASFRMTNKICKLIRDRRMDRSNKACKGYQHFDLKRFCIWEIHIFQRCQHRCSFEVFLRVCPVNLTLCNLTQTMKHFLFSF